MTDDKRLDESISRLIQGIQLDIPPSIEEEINKKSVGARPYPDLPSYRRLLWTLLPSGAALILGVLLLMHPPMKPPISDISEIRTQFEIADKNITVVFYQRTDSHFPRED
jgi:hypothetical protein